MMIPPSPRRHSILTLLVPLAIASAMFGAYAQAADLTIDRARWDADDARLEVRGDGSNGQRVEIRNAGSGAVLGSVTVRDEEWRFRQSDLASVPCRVTAEQSNGHTVTRDVRDAPADCDMGDQAGDPPAAPATGDFTILAANDLGMHCADLDYQVFSILPPFNVAHAQVIRRGTANSLPSIVDDAVAEVVYSATSSDTDPAGAGSINTTSQNSNGVFKTNFWEEDPPNSRRTLGGRAYAPLYPGIHVIDNLGGPDLTGLCGDPANEADCPSALTLFEPIAPDTGIPVPDPLALFATPPLLVTDQQHMPGPANTPQAFDRFDSELPFFVNFPFGSRLADRNWFAADGIPILPVDDSGRSNAYPLMKIAARDRQSGNELASVDIVLPVASEADCQNCHVEPIDCADLGLPFEVQATSDACNGSGVSRENVDFVSLDGAPGDTRLEQLLNTAKINILRLHDAKHGDTYQDWDANKQLVGTPCDATDPTDPNCLDNQRPIQCSRCHYSPALDLAQAGPVDEPEQGAKNGRQQSVHITMSRAMHGHHGALPPFQDEPLFPAMPQPNDRTPAQAQTVLEETCYQCHPGKRTQCLRGAMFAGGVVCQDCHGDMEQVGNDFSIRVAADNAGDFVTDGSLRVPWASEPGCQSCHTGDAVNKNHPDNAIVADDGIRLLQAFRSETIDVPGVNEPVRVATMFQRPASRFAENRNTNAAGAEVDVLYRLSTGHGGVMCEGCHNSTHAIWPTQFALANDNVAARQLQGHTGSILECTTCHEAGSLPGNLEGPHGLHPINDANFIKGGDTDHIDLAKQANRAAERGGEDACAACHGVDHRGTVLSRAPIDRELRDADGELLATVQAGEQIGCGICHSLADSFGD